LPYTSKSLNAEIIPLTFNKPPKVVLPLTLRVDFNNVYCYTSKDPNMFVLYPGSEAVMAPLIVVVSVA